MGRTKGFKFPKTETSVCEYCGSEFKHAKVFIQKPRFCPKPKDCRLISWALRKANEQNSLTKTIEVLK